MQEQRYRLTDSTHPLVDVDLMSNGEPVGVVRDETGFSLLLFDTRYPLPDSMRFPLVRIIGDEHILIADTRTKRNVQNAWVYDLAGQRIGEFRLGDAIEDILSFPRHIAVTYFDEGYGNTENLFGIVVFEEDGTPRWHDPVFDCYCACARGSRYLLYLFYPEFLIRQLDLASFQLEEWRAPDSLKGASAVTSREKEAFFHAPYADETGIYRWEIGASRTERIGEYGGRLRGLQNGRFITYTETECIEIML
jgi:hypothetical protein